jgi:hypothetical protein
VAQPLAELERAAQSAPPPWLWVAVLLGALLRAYLVVYTEGTHDVPIWESHAGWTAEHGLIGYYGFQEVFNHPPFIGRLLSEVWILAKAADVPFRIPHRALFSLFDLGNALLLLSFFRASSLRYAIFAAYWLNPLAIIFSAYHGNTDTAVAFFVLLAVSLAAKQRVAWTGVAIGVGLWFKLPTILAVPALLFFFAGFRNRLLFVGVAFAVGASTYLSTAIQAWDLLYARVLAYPGLDIVTPGGIPVWGVWNVFGIVESLPAGIAGPLRSLNSFHRAHNSALAILPILVFAFLRRRETEPRQLGVTVCASLLIFHGLTNFWAYQYLAWLLPFLIFPGLWFFALGTLAIGSFIYCLYVMLCGNFFLLGKWDFNAFPFWPVGILRLRDTAVLFCFVSAAAFTVSAIRNEWQHLRPRGAR